MSAFAGFPRDLPAFLTELAANNSKGWFDANRARYEASYRDPARAFVEAMEAALSALGPGFNADPRPHGSILRINRDIRFSKDKTPYNAYLRLLFWQGPGKPRESTGLFFGLAPGELFVGGGIYGFGPEQLKRYRAALANPAKARALEQAIARVDTKGHTLGEPHLKRVPKEIDPDHPQANLFLYKGLYAGVHMGVEDWLFTPACVERVMEGFAAVRPLQAWLAETVTP